MTMTYESRMLIDGKLIEASGGATYDNINPATEAVIGPVADGSAADMESAITAARRAFDETTWSTDPAFRKACLLQLKDALAGASGGSAPADRGRGRCADRPDLRDPTGQLHRRHAVGHRPHRPLRVGVRARRPRVLRHEVEPARGARADRRRRRDHAVELPVHAQPVEARARARRRLHRDPQARARHAVLGHVDRQADCRGDRHSRRCGERRDLGRSRDRGRRADRRPAGRHDLLHRLDRGRQAHRRARRLR